MLQPGTSLSCLAAFGLLVGILFGLSEVLCDNNDEDTLCHQFKSGSVTIMVMAATHDARILLLDTDFTGFIVPLKNLHDSLAYKGAPKLNLSTSDTFHLKSADLAKLPKRTTGRGVFFYKGNYLDVRYPWYEQYLGVMSPNLKTITMLPVTSEGEFRTHPTNRHPPESDIFFSRSSYSTYMLNGTNHLVMIQLGLDSKYGNQFTFSPTRNMPNLPIRPILNESQTDGGFVLYDSIAYGYSNQLKMITVYKSADDKEVMTLPFRDFFVCKERPSPKTIPTSNPSPAPGPNPGTNPASNPRPNPRPAAGTSTETSTSNVQALSSSIWFVAISVFLALQIGCIALCVLVIRKKRSSRSKTGKTKGSKSKSKTKSKLKSKSLKLNKTPKSGSKKSSKVRKSTGTSSTESSTRSTLKKSPAGSAILVTRSHPPTKTPKLAPLLLVHVKHDET